MKFRNLAFIATAAMLSCMVANVTASDKTAGQAQSAAITAAAPTIEVPILRHQFEPVVDGMEVNHAFSLKNIGDGPLIIQHVKTG